MNPPTPLKRLPRPLRPPAHAATGTFIDCPTCRHKIGDLWAPRFADGTYSMSAAQLVSNRTGELVGQVWRFGPVVETPTRLDLPARVQCRKGHESSITLDGRGRTWKAHPIGK